MSNVFNYFVFTIDNQQFAIHLDSVWRVIRSQAVKRIPDAPSFIIGLMDYYGEIIPVINMRKRLGYAERAISVSDRFILVSSKDIHLALVADEVNGYVQADTGEIIESGNLIKGLRFVRIMKYDQGIVLIYDLEELLNNMEMADIAHLIESGDTEKVTG